MIVSVCPKRPMPDISFHKENPVSGHVTAMGKKVERVLRICIYSASLLSFFFLVVFCLSRGLAQGVNESCRAPPRIIDLE